MAIDREQAARIAELAREITTGLETPFEKAEAITDYLRSEISYTGQRPAEYTFVIMAAALREGWTGPVFIQGDHFQVNAKKYAVDAAGEVGNVKQLALEAIAAGFYNIDIDTSTLVDLSQGTLADQQRLNYEVGVDITRHVRALEPAGVTISLGGEIGEVGTENSTVPELRAFMDGYRNTLAAQAPVAAAPRGRGWWARGSPAAARRASPRPPAGRRRTRWATSGPRGCRRLGCSRSAAPHRAPPRRRARSRPSRPASR